MIITYFGKQFFKITQGDLTIAFNPIGKNSKFLNKISKFGADIALSTTNHPDYNGFEILGHGEYIPFKIYGAGSYEVEKTIIGGIDTESFLGKEKYINTIYNLTVDNILISFLGPISSIELGPSVLEKIDTPDILFLPIGGGDLIEPEEAYKLASSIGPKIIIPMDYDEKSLKQFLKEAGQDNVKKIEKLTLKQKDLVGQESQVVVLSS